MARVQIVVRGGRVPAQPPHFHFERVRDAARVPVAAKRAAAPFGGLGCEAEWIAQRIGIFDGRHGARFFMSTARAL